MQVLFYDINNIYLFLNPLSYSASVCEAYMLKIAFLTNQMNATECDSFIKIGQFLFIGVKGVKY